MILSFTRSSSGESPEREWLPWAKRRRPAESGADQRSGGFHSKLGEDGTGLAGRQPAKEKPLFIQEEAAYIGSESCIGCHEEPEQGSISMPGENLRWPGRPFRSFRTRRTGQNALPAMPPVTIPEKKTYKEENVGCEACHGPGEKYQEMMAGADALEGGRIARENALKSCTRCHHPHTNKEEHVILARKGLVPYP